MGCDDGDFCTNDACDPLLGCIHPAMDPTTAVGTLCEVANVRSAVRSSGLCARSCPRVAERRLIQLATAVDRATRARGAKRCRQQMRRALRLAGALSRQMAGFTAVDPDASPAARTLDLRTRTAMLAGTFCATR